MHLPAGDTEGFLRAIFEAMNELKDFILATSGFHDKLLKAIFYNQTQSM